ncbi:conserved hypothetical protein [Trichinella spiralis]|uniref:hypothetical protein n=1 Tax=Trichinella spiralis TaxID=6334 RepID=UPI0001EFCB39|nr:conserved hypothetical protein [Trichinella spiralis]
MVQFRPYFDPIFLLVVKRAISLDHRDVVLLLITTEIHRWFEVTLRLDPDLPLYFNQSIRQQYKGPIKQRILRPIRKRGQNIARSGPKRETCAYSPLYVRQNEV